MVPDARRIGGSDLCVLLGVSSFSTPSQLARRLRTGVDDRSAAFNATVGLTLEADMLRWYAEQVGAHVEPAPPLEGEWWRATPDGIGHLYGRTYGIEIKVWDWTRRREFGEPGTNQVPVQLTAQTQWYMHWAGWESMDAIVSFGTRDPTIYHIPADRALQDRLVRLARTFYQRAMTEEPIAFGTPEPPAAEPTKLGRDEVMESIDTIARVRYLAKASRIEKLAKQRRELAKAWAISHVHNQPGRIRVPGVTVSVYETKHGLGVRVRED